MRRSPVKAALGLVCLVGVGTVSCQSSSHGKDSSEARERLDKSPWHAATTAIASALVPSPEAIDDTIDSHDAVGPGWSRLSGNFASIATGVHVDRLDQVAFLVDADAQLLHPLAEVVMVSKDEPMVIVAVSPRRIPPTTDPDLVVATGMERIVGSVPTGEQKSLRAFERDVELRMFRQDPRIAATHRMRPNDDAVAGSVLFGDRMIEIVAWFPQGQYAAAEPRLKGMVEALRYVEPAPSIAEQEAAREHAWAQLGPSDVFRDGVYRDYATGLLWTAPSTGFWRPLLGDRALRLDITDRVTLEEPMSDLQVVLGVRSEAHASSHDAVARSFLRQTATPYELDLAWTDDGISTQASEGTAVELGVEKRCIVATVSVDHTTYYGVASFPAHLGIEGEQRAHDALGGLRIRDVRSPRTHTATSYRDEQVGLSFRFPEGFASTPGADTLAGTGVFGVRAARGDALMLVASMRGFRSEEAIAAAKDLLDIDGALGAPQPKPSVTVDGIKGQRFELAAKARDIDVVVFTMHGITHVLSAHGEEGVLDEILETVRFLPPPS